MVEDVEIEQFPHGRLDLLDTRVTEFNHFATIHTDQVVVLFETMGFLVLGKIFPKLVLGDKIATYQELKSVVNRCPAHPVVGVFHVYIQSLCIKMISTAVDLLQDRITLRCFTEVVLFKMPREDFFDLYK